MTTVTGEDARRVADRCQKVLPLAQANLSGEYGYRNLPLCVIDAVWSIGVRYEGVKNIVMRYCDYFMLPHPWREDYGVSTASAEDEHTISQMLKNMQELGIATFTEHIFQNRQRTSTRNGILKTEAVYQFASALNKHEINCLHEIPNYGAKANFENEIRIIPGQASGKSLKYFFMLCGDVSLMKPDRWTLLFLEQMLQRPISDTMAQEILAQASQILQEIYSEMTPRLLDHEIWKYQKDLRI